MYTKPKDKGEMSEDRGSEYDLSKNIVFTQLPSKNKASKFYCEALFPQGHSRACDAFQAD